MMCKIEVQFCTVWGFVTDYYIIRR